MDWPQTGQGPVMPASAAGTVSWFRQDGQQKVMMADMMVGRMGYFFSSRPLPVAAPSSSYSLGRNFLKRVLSMAFM